MWQPGKKAGCRVYVSTEDQLAFGRGEGVDGCAGVTAVACVDPWRILVGRLYLERRVEVELAVSATLSDCMTSCQWTSFHKQR